MTVGLILSVLTKMKSNLKKKEEHMEKDKSCSTHTNSCMRRNPSGTLEVFHFEKGSFSFHRKVILKQECPWKASSPNFCSL